MLGSMTQSSKPPGREAHSTKSYEARPTTFKCADFQRWQECYDDAMNSADEHGIIHPEACKPIFDIDIGNTTTITSTNGTASVASSIPKDAEQTVSAPGNGTALITSCSPARNSSSAAAVAEGTASATTVGDESSGDAEGEAVGKQMGSNLLSASIELLEIARPEIAASTVVAGVCKVWRTDFQREGVMCCRMHALRALLTQFVNASSLNMREGAPGAAGETR